MCRDFKGHGNEMCMMKSLKKDLHIGTENSWEMQERIRENERERGYN